MSTHNEQSALRVYGTKQKDIVKRNRNIQLKLLKYFNSIHFSCYFGARGEGMPMCFIDS